MLYSGLYQCSIGGKSGTVLQQEMSACYRKRLTFQQHKYFNLKWHKRSLNCNY
jgi:hypothetical protein